MNQSRPVIVIIYLTFFVISFLTNILGPIIPDIISGFHLSLTMAAVLPFSFFIAYGFLSIPAGFLVERFGEKPTMTGAFFLAGAGALTFAILPVFAVHAQHLKGGDSHTLVGIALGAYGLTQGVLQIPFGMASDRYGRKRVLIIGLLLFGAASAVSAFATAAGRGAPLEADSARSLA